MLPPTSNRQQATGSGNRNSNNNSNYGNGATICEGAIRVAGWSRNRNRNKAKRIHHPRLTFKGQRWSINQSARWGWNIRTLESEGNNNKNNNGGARRARRVAGAGQAKQTLAQTDRIRRAGGPGGSGQQISQSWVRCLPGKSLLFSWHFDLLILAPQWMGVAANILLLLCKYSTVGVGHAEAGERRGSETGLLIDAIKRPQPRKRELSSVPRDACSEAECAGSHAPRYTKIYFLLRQGRLSIFNRHTHTTKTFTSRILW